MLDHDFRQPELARDLSGFVGVRWLNLARANGGQIEPHAPAGTPTIGPRWMKASARGSSTASTS